MEGALFLSSRTRGRYAVGDSDGPELSSGQGIELYIAHQWIPGRVEYSPDPLYVTLGPQTLGEVAQMAMRPKAIGGYYVEIADGGIIGLCVGMFVRTL